MTQGKQLKQKIYVSSSSFFLTPIPQPRAELRAQLTKEMFYILPPSSSFLRYRLIGCNLSYDRWFLSRLLNFYLIYPNNTTLPTYNFYKSLKLFLFFLSTSICSEHKLYTSPNILHLLISLISDIYRGISSTIS